MTKAEQYIQAIKSGKVNHGKWLKLLIDWHLRELKTSELYEYREDISLKYVNFIEKLEFTQGKWAGQPFYLQDWQAFFISLMFGWVRKDNGLRRFKQVTLNVPKKKRKN